MSTVFDVQSVTVDADTSVTFSVDAVDSVVITDALDPVTVTVEAGQPVSGVVVEVPGLQGPPGDQMVYSQLNNPAIEYGWGPEDAGKIWIEVNV